MRVVVWFSCGAASAVAGKLAIEKYSSENVHLAYCDVLSSEHPDNTRFMRDVEEWLGKKVEIISSSKYTSIDDVFEKTRYMSGIAGARCTVELKKVPRFDYQDADDIHIFGMTVDEQHRIDRIENNNPELKLDWILRDAGYSKEMCFEELRKAGIELPVMYKLGFHNNNCIGCVKAQSIPYWKNVRRHFPDVFERRAKQSRELGVKLVRINGDRAFIDEIPEEKDWLFEVIEENISCGPECADTGVEE